VASGTIICVQPRSDAIGTDMRSTLGTFRASGARLSGHDRPVTTCRFVTSSRRIDRSLTKKPVA